MRPLRVDDGERDVARPAAGDGVGAGDAAALQQADSAAGRDAGTSNSRSSSGDRRSARGGILRPFTVHGTATGRPAYTAYTGPGPGPCLAAHKGVRVEASRSVIPLDATQAAEIVDRIVTNVKRVIHAPFVSL